MTNSKQPHFRPNNRHFAVLDALSDYKSDEELAERLKAEAVSLSVNEEELVSAYIEIIEAVSDNDVEGATIGIAAVRLTYPDHDSEEYHDACFRIMNLRCPLLRLEAESGSSLAGGWQTMAEEMMDMILTARRELRRGSRSRFSWERAGALLARHLLGGLE
jgi:hypothetical protein